MNFSFLSIFKISRNKVLIILIILFCFVLITKLFLLQIVHKGYFTEKADRQYVKNPSQLFERGNIYFKNKNGEYLSAATQTVEYNLAIHPTEIKDAESVYNKLSSIVKVNKEEYDTKVNKKNDPYELIADGLSKEVADKLFALKLQGIDISKSKKRFYPGDTMASHTIGVVAYKGDDLSGRYGLERTYDNVLNRSKDDPYVNFFAEVFSNINKTFFDNNSKEGDIVTTIEPRVESVLEIELTQVKEKYNVDSVGGIIMNPKDGSIYAISVLPSFDLNNFGKVKDVKILSNPIVENVLEFGSVIKPLVMAGALNEKVLTADTKYNDTGSVIVDKKVIYNFDKKGRGEGTTMQDVLNQSLNTGMVYVYKALGKDKLRDYLIAYGLKEKTGIDLPNETSGLVSNLFTPRDLEYANASFGQGIALTPIEITRALASLANGGELVTPHLVEKIEYTDGTEKKIEYEKSSTKITEETATEISRMLVKVMDNYLKDRNAKLENYSIAGKTGTAQVADNINGGYYKDRHTHSYFGYFPAKDPQFIIFLYAVNPKGVSYASGTWTDTFLNITKFLINYYQIPPDR